MSKATENEKATEKDDGECDKSKLIVKQRSDAIWLGLVEKGHFLPECLFLPELEVAAGKVEQKPRN